MIDSLNISCPCYLQDSHKNSKLIIQCTSCKKYQHKFCMKSMAKMPRYQCPYCQLKKGSLFFNTLYSLIEPTLVEFNPFNKILNAWITFIPDTSVYSTFSKKFNDSPRVILIRCMRLDNNGFSFHWPKMSKIYLNDKIILDLTKKGYKQKDRMIALIPWKDYDNENIRKKFFLYDSHIIKNEDFLIEKKPNRFQIEIILNEREKMEYTNFLISIDLCEIYKNPESIINEIPIINSKKEIKKILSNNEIENNILSIKERVSLLDIYTETDKIQIPARGINCCHLNVFDLKTFLSINRKGNKYKCPYCKRYSNDLYVDGIIYDFLKNPDNKVIKEIFIDKELNISLDDKKTENYLETNNNSNSNDETYKTEYNKNIEKYNVDENINHKHFKLKRKKPNLIKIVDDDSENNNENGVNENDFNNNNCNIISDLGIMFNQIREEILSDKKAKKNKNNGNENKNLKNQDINENSSDNNLIIHDNILKLPIFKKKNIPFKNISKKRKRYYTVEKEE